MKNKVQICKVILLVLTVLYFVLCCCNCTEKHITSYTESGTTVDVRGESYFSVFLAVSCGASALLILLEKPVLQLIAGLFAASSGLVLPLKILVYRLLEDVYYCQAVLPGFPRSSNKQLMTPVGICVTVLAWVLVAAQILLCVLLLKKKKTEQVMEYVVSDYTR